MAVPALPGTGLAGIEAAKSEPFYRKSLKMRIRLHGESHPDATESYNNLALNPDVQKHDDEDEPFLHKNLDICEKLFVIIPARSVTLLPDDHDAGCRNRWGMVGCSLICISTLSEEGGNFYADHDE